MVTQIRASELAIFAAHTPAGLDNPSFLIVDDKRPHGLAMTIPRLDVNAVDMMSRRSNGHASLRLSAHIFVLLGTGALIYLGHHWCQSGATNTAWNPSPWPYLVLVAALVGHGIVLSSLLAPLHETIHHTAFRSRWLNLLVSKAIGFLLFRPPRFFRAQHFYCHHGDDGDATTSALCSRRDAPQDHRTPIARHSRIGGAATWFSGISRMLCHAFNISSGQYLSSRKRRRIANEARVYLACYGLTAAVAGLLNLHWPIVLFWVIPLLIGLPCWRLFPFSEHLETHKFPQLSPLSRRGHRRPWIIAAQPALPIRYLNWNLSYYDVHGAYPGVPFHALPNLHRFLKAAELTTPILTERVVIPVPKLAEIHDDVPVKLSATS